MTPLRQGYFIRRAKDISIGSTLALAMLASGVALPGCNGGQDNEAAYSYDDTTYEKGIRSYIKEVAPGEFKITDEQTVEYDQSEAIVSYLDGTSRTLNPEAAKRLIDEEIQSKSDSTSTRDNERGYHRSGLSNVLLYGGMGYLLGRNRSYSYINNYRSNNRAGQYYNDPRTYQKAQSARSAMRASRTTAARPSGGRSGFFGGSPARGNGVTYKEERRREERRKNQAVRAAGANPPSILSSLLLSSFFQNDSNKKYAPTSRRRPAGGGLGLDAGRGHAALLGTESGGGD